MCLERSLRLQARSILVFLGLGCLAPLAFAGNVIRVGPGQTFAEIGPAVARAAHGDLILVTPGTYAPFVVDGKGVSIVGDGGAFVLAQTPGVPEILVRNIPPGRDVTIDSAHIDFKDEGAPAVSVSNNAGSVKLRRLRVQATDHLFFGTTAQAMVEVEHTALFWLIDSSISAVGLDALGQPTDFVVHTLRPRIGNDGVSGLQLLDSHGIVQNSRMRGFRSLRPQAFGGDGLRLVDEGPDFTDASAWLLQDRLGPANQASFKGGNGLNGGHAVHQIRDPFERSLIRACGGDDDQVTLTYGPGFGEPAFGGKIGGLYGTNNSNGGNQVPGVGIAFRPPDHCHDAWRNESSVASGQYSIGSSFDVRVRSRMDRSFLVIFTGSSSFQFAPTTFTGRAVLDASSIFGWKWGTTPAKTTATISMPIPVQPALVGLQITVQTAFGPIGGNLNNLGMPSFAVIVP
jgi:hypothetical protein